MHVSFLRDIRASPPICGRSLQSRAPPICITMTDWAQLSKGASAIGAIVYGAGAIVTLAWAALIIYGKKFRHAEEKTYPMLRALRTASFVWGLTCLLYTWLAIAGNAGIEATYRWLVYAICSMDLFAAAIFLRSLFDSSARRGTHVIISEMTRAVVFISVGSGFVVAYFGVTGGGWAPYVAFVVASVFFVMLAFFFSTTGPHRIHSAHSTYNTLIVVALLCWTAYPTLFALNILFGIITNDQAAFGYVIADVVTKFSFVILALFIAYGDSRCRRYRQECKDGKSSAALLFQI